MVCHSIVLFPLAVCVSIVSMWHIASLYALCKHSHWSYIMTLSVGIISSQCPCDCCVTALESAQTVRYNYAFAFHGNTITIIASSCLIGQYLSSPGSTSSLVCGHPEITHVVTICSSAASFIATLISSLDVHIGMSTVVLIICMFIFMPVISWTQFFAWL